MMNLSTLANLTNGSVSGKLFAQRLSAAAIISVSTVSFGAIAISGLPAQAESPLQNSTQDSAQGRMETIAEATTQITPQMARLLETGVCQSCDLTGADLTGAHLIGVDLRGADLTNAQMAQSNLEGADLTGSTLINTNLSGAYLTNTILDNAIVSNVDFSGATLVHTSLENAKVDNVNLADATVLNTPISIGGSYDE